MKKTKENMIELLPFEERIKVSLFEKTYRSAISGAVVKIQLQNKSIREIKVALKELN